MILKLRDLFSTSKAHTFRKKKDYGKKTFFFEVNKKNYVLECAKNRLSMNRNTSR